MTLGELIKAKRESRGWSLRDMAEKCPGFSFTALWRIESGHADRATLATLSEIASAFGMGAADLLREAGYSVTDAPPEQVITIRVTGGLVSIDKGKP